MNRQRPKPDEFDELDDDEQLTWAEATELRQTTARWREDNRTPADPNTPMAVACVGVICSIAGFAGAFAPCFGLLAIFGVVCALNAIATRQHGADPLVVLATALGAIVLAGGALVALAVGLMNRASG